MRTTTESAQRRAFWLTLTAIFACAFAGACRSPKSSETTGGGSAENATTPKLDAFEVTLELPPAPGAAAPVPPEGALRPFRVWKNQELPRQKKTPEWRSVPAKEGVVLDMASDGKWRCVVNPARVFGKFDEDRTVLHWTTSRTVRCSSDGGKTHVEGLVRAGYAPDGKPVNADPRAALQLKDVVNGQPRLTIVVLEVMPVNPAQTN